MSNCLECNKPLPPRTEGKRERKFCDNKGACKQKYWVKQNAKNPVTITIPLGDLSEGEIYSWINGELIKIDKKLNTLNNIKTDSAETKETTSEIKSELLSKYETELSELGDGQFAKARKKWLTTKIKELTSQH